MKIKNHFYQLKLEYPIADRLNIGAREIATYNGTLNKIEICDEIWKNLEDKYREILKENGVEHTQNFGISCTFTSEPYFDVSSDEIKYKYVFIIYFYVMYPEFKKKGFYCQGNVKYYDDETTKHELSPVNKKEENLFSMTKLLNSLVVSFAENKLDV